MARPRLRIHGWRDERRVPLQFWPDDSKPLDPHLYVEHDWDPRERAQVLAYLNACYEAPFMSPYPFIWCPFGCKHPNPRGQVMVTDGTWWFMDIAIHYLQDHAVKPPAEFLDAGSDDLWLWISGARFDYDRWTWSTALQRRHGNTALLATPAAGSLNFEPAPAVLTEWP